MVALEALADAEEDVHRLLEGGLLDHDRLEAALEGGVLLDVLAELVERGGADALQLAARQRRLQDVGRVDGALGSAGAHERVQLVDEEDGVVRAAQLLDDLLEPLLELAAVLRAGHQRADVQGEHPLVSQALGDVTADDAMSQALGDGRLAHAGLADEGGVVLAAAREDLDDALDLLLATDDRVELARPGGLGEVDAELVDRGRLAAALRLARGRSRGARLREHADDLVADLVEVDAQRFEDACGDALAFADEARGADAPCRCSCAPGAAPRRWPAR